MYYVSLRIRQSVTLSLSAGELLVEEVDKTILSKFKPDEEKKKHVEILEYCEQ